MSRLSLLTVLIAATAFSTACRQTHDASPEEMQNLNQISSTISTQSGVADDQGDASVGSIFSIQPLFQNLADKDNTQAAGFGMRSGSPSVERLAYREFEDCVVDTADGVEYQDCGWGASGSGGSLSFLLTGFINYTDTSLNSDLLFDLSVGGEAASVGTTMEWQGNAEWSETTFDGDFHLNWGIDVELIGVGIPGTGAELDIKADYATLEWDEACEDGPIAGIIDWKSMLREGSDPPERRHVTIEYLSCGAATITW